MKIKFLLSDLDGVIRHYPSDRAAEIERRYGLEEGTLFKTAFEKPLLQEAVCGKISDQEWRARIAAKLAPRYANGEAAVREWSGFAGNIDHAYLECLSARWTGIPVAVLTNATSRLNSDLAALGLENRFHKVFNSSEIGVCKPDPKVYAHVIAALGCAPSEILFVDDSLAHVKAGEDAGMQTHHYTSLAGFVERFKNC